MKFKCPSCDMQLKVEPEMAGKVVRCPGCNTKLQIPEAGPGDLPSPSGLPTPSNFGAPAPDGMKMPPASSGAGYAPSSQVPQEEFELQEQRQARGGWEETDPTNPNMLMSLGLGLVLFFTWFGIIYPFQAPDTVAQADFTGMQWIANLFYKHLLVSATNTLFFTWSMSMLFFKFRKLRHQREALLLDVLPVELGHEITVHNVSQFIDHLYSFPHRLRDSMMVNRIRKALELFEQRPNVGDVATMMHSQSNIDGARIGGSYNPLKAFLWAIPILGFVGTVIGLSHAIGGMNFANVDDVKAIIAQVNTVTSGLGTAFDATLLGLVLAMALNFPMNAMSKAEDDNLNNIDAFCDEILLPRLNDGAGIAGGDSNALMDTLVKAVAGSQKEFLVDLNTLSIKIKDFADNLDKRAAAHQERVDGEFAQALNRMREDFTNAVKDSVKTSTEYNRALASGIQSLNNVLTELGGKQIIIHQTKKKGWFSRD